MYAWWRSQSAYSHHHVFAYLVLGVVVVLVCRRDNAGIVELHVAQLLLAHERQVQGRMMQGRLLVSAKQQHILWHC